MHFHNYPSLWKQTFPVFGFGRWMKASTPWQGYDWELQLCSRSIVTDVFYRAGCFVWLVFFVALCPAAIFLKGSLALSFLFHFRHLCKPVTLLFCCLFYSMWHRVYIANANSGKIVTHQTYNITAMFCYQH